MQKLLKSKRGAFIILWAILLPVLLGMTGVVIDFGSAYAERTRLQHVVDAAALAGAVPIGPSSDEVTKAAAKKLVNDYIAKNNCVLTSPPEVEFSEKAITIDIPYTGEKKTLNVNKISVNLRTEVPTYFLKIFNLKNFNVAAHAAAIGPLPPNPLDYALVSAGDQEFILFGEGAPAANQYAGSVWANGKIKIDQNEAVHKKEQVIGDIVTASPDKPSDINKHKIFENQVITDQDKIKVDYEGANRNPIIDALVDSITNKANTYSPTHKCNIDGSIDYTKLGGPLYVNGDFNKNTLISPNNTFTTAGDITIVATGNIKLTDAVVSTSSATIIICSLNGDIEFNGSIENFPNVVFLAPRGKVKMTCGITHMTGSIIGQEVSVGNAGNLQIKNTPPDDYNKYTKLQLVE